MATIKYSADDSAVLIDPYNDFMSKGGKYCEATKETAEAVGFYDNMRKLIPAVRAAKQGLSIICLNRPRYLLVDGKNI
jgi:hypothetical protein